MNHHLQDNKPPYSIEDIRKADSDSWLKGATGEYRKTFVTRAAFTLFGFLFLTTGMMLFCMSFLFFLGAPNLYPVAIFTSILSVFWVPVTFITTYRLWKHSLDAIVKVTVPRYILFLISFAALISFLWIKEYPIRWSPTNVSHSVDETASNIAKTRSIQGSPDRSEIINDETWDFYGNSYIQFDRRGNVKHIYNAGDLKNVKTSRIAKLKQSSQVARS